MIETQAVIIGAGPVGLFQVFELGLLGIKAHVIEALDQPGGQCSELYPDKPIYDIPAAPAIGAQELTDRLLEQIEPFEPTFHFGQTVLDCQRQPDNRFRLTTSRGQAFLTDSVIIAAGVGAFQPVRLKVAGIERHLNEQLFYRVKDKSLHEGKDIVILGGGDSALDWALDLQGIANSVILIHRSEQFRAAPDSVAKMRALCEQQEMQFVQGQITDFADDGEGRLAQIKVTGSDGVTRRIPLDQLLVFFGLSPKLGPIEHWGLDFHRKQIQVDTEKYQTSAPGIYAVGDINWYPGKKKLILSGFHESALAAFAIKAQLEPEKKVHLQYTTTSPIMHERLQVDNPYTDAA